ncbi:MAG TPA: TolC family protein [Bryobacteraceae bacterium]|nr:TolC family protein [Bryobacteraceae bacterium]
MRRFFFFLAAVGAAFGEVRTVTLPQVLQMATSQNAEVVMARLEQKRAASASKAAKDPFYPKIFAGSGLAYSSGFPMSIEGSAPSIIEARAIASVFNHEKRMLLEKARADEKTAAVATAAKEDDIAYRAAVLYVEAGRLAAARRAIGEQMSALEKVEQSVKARVAEGRELPIEARRATLRILQAKQRLQRMDVAQADAESQLALLAGMADGDRARPAEPGTPVKMGVTSEGDAVVAALQNNREIRRLETVITAKGFERKSYDATKLPRLDLVAQYGLFSKFNNYDKFFNRFQRHNGQLGVSIQIPLVPSFAAKAQRESVDVEMVGLRTQINAERGRASAQARKFWAEVAAQETSVEVATLDLQVAREQTSVLLSLVDEGRATQKQLEEARFLENEKWMALFDARFGLDRARLDLLKETGTLVSTLRN